jgi:dihydrolipoamide dehydrogenase
MYDVIIIGGGPAGYLAAERLGHHGKSVLLIEKSLLGGTCLNVGCIPTKTLLNSAKHYVHALEAPHYGVTAEKVSYDWKAMQAWKAEVVDKLRAGIASQMKRFKVEVVEGSAEFEAPGRVLVRPSSGGERHEEARAVLVATGSSPAMPPVPGAKGNPLVVDSTGLLEAAAVPKRLCVIGGGVIGVEFASLFSSLGSEVTVVEMLDEIVPFMDADQAPILRRALRQLKWKLGCKVEAIEGGTSGAAGPATVRYSTKDGAKESVEADLVLMAVGRRPNVAGFGAERIGLDAPPKGVAVDERMRTNVPGVWAAGDVTGRSLLAHSAYRMAEVAVCDILARLDGQGEGGERMRYDAIPWAVYSIPEAAGVGMTEQEAKARGIEVKKAQIPLRVSGRFAAENGFAAQGAVKLVVEAASRRILGLHAVGAYASETIWGGAALIEQELRVEDLRALVFPHPTVYELVRDAAWEIE